MKLTILFLTLCSMISSCAPMKYNAKYQFGLSEAMVDQVITHDQSNPQQLTQFEDQDVRFLFDLNDSKIQFKLINKTDKPIKLIWDESRFIDAAGNTHKVFHNGIKFNDRELSKPASVINQGELLNDQFVPTSYAYFLGKNGEWSQHSVLPELKQNASEDEKSALVSYISTQNAEKPLLFKTLFTLEVNGVKKPYLFAFNIHSAEVIESQ